MSNYAVLKWEVYYIAFLAFQTVLLNKDGVFNILKLLLIIGIVLELGCRNQAFFYWDG